MAWLRIDDGFTANAKIAQLTDAEFRVWMRLLCHCASSRDPSVDSVARREVSGLSSARVKRFLELDLLDRIGGDYEVHDWANFLPKDGTNAERQARWRARKRHASNGTHTVTETVTRGVTEPVTETVTSSRARDAGAGTRGVPSRPQEQEQPGAVPVARPPEPPLGPRRTAPGDNLDTLGAEIESALRVAAEGGR